MKDGFPAKWGEHYYGIFAAAGPLSIGTGHLKPEYELGLRFWTISANIGLYRQIIRIWLSK